MTPARVEGSDYPCLITDYNDLGGGRFADPRSRQSFRYDHLRKEASDFQVRKFAEKHAKNKFNQIMGAKLRLVDKEWRFAEK